MTSKIVVKGYKVGQKIDQAGLRTMYEAYDLRSGSKVFLTVIAVRPGRALNQLIKRAEQSQQLRHPAIVSALDYGILPDDCFYYSHPASPSFPVLQVLDQIHDPEENLFTTLRFFIDTCEAVRYIHDAQTTHRDLGSSLIRVDQDDKVLLEGFINARPKIEARNVVNVVTLPYMSPEQLMGAAADRKTDIYSLGTILFEWATGTVPYDSNYAKVEDARQGVIPSPSMFRMDIPEALETIMMKTLSPRASRYRSVHELLEDLHAFNENRSFRLKFRDFTSSLKGIFSRKPSRSR